MKLDQQQQAHRLYFQTDLSKTQIADAVGISRRSLHNWIRDNHWEQIKRNAEVIPSFIAENCYQVLGNLTGHLLSADRLGQPATIQEVNAIYKLTLTINKLKAKNTLNESMETLAWFTESVERKDPELAQKLQPHLDEYITARAAKGTTQYWQSKIAAVDKHTQPHTEATDAEMRLDMEDLMAWSQPENAEPTVPQASSNSAAPKASAIPSSQAAPQPGKAGKSLRDMLRGTATTGPSKVLRQTHSAAA